MTSYRFCRPDDMPLLINAINRCIISHQPSEQIMDIVHYKTLVRRYNLWASSCMIAFEGDENRVISAVIGCKRETETLVLMLGSHHEHLRKGHVSHMLGSLQNKLAILGPPRIIAEVPEDNHAAVLLCEKMRYLKQEVYEDYILDSNMRPVRTTSETTPLTRSQILELVSHEATKSRAWVRQRKTLENLQEELCGVAISGSEKENFIIYFNNREAGRYELLSLHLSDQTRHASHLTSMLAGIVAAAAKPIFVPKLEVKELTPLLLIEVGFQRLRRYIKFSWAAR